MSTVAEARRAELDADLDAQPAGSVPATELFGVVDALEAHVALRRALSDPGADPGARAELVSRIFAPRVSKGTVDLVTRAAQRRWSGGGSLVAALERQAVRSELKAAQADGSLDDVEDELFRFGQTVQGHRELAAALASEQVPIANRQQLVDDLLRARAGAHTLTLARRAVASRDTGFVPALDAMLKVAADLRSRALAKVTVARPLDEVQYQRLRVLLMRMLGRGVDIQVTVDPAVLGGMRVQVGDEVIEGTVAQRLEDAGRQLA